MANPVFVVLVVLLLNSLNLLDSNGYDDGLFLSHKELQTRFVSAIQLNHREMILNKLNHGDEPVDEHSCSEHTNCGDCAEATGCGWCPRRLKKDSDGNQLESICTPVNSRGRPLDTNVKCDALNLPSESRCDCHNGFLDQGGKCSSCLAEKGCGYCSGIRKEKYSDDFTRQCVPLEFMGSLECLDFKAESIEECPTKDCADYTEESECVTANIDGTETGGRCGWCDVRYINQPYYSFCMPAVVLKWSSHAVDSTEIGPDWRVYNGKEYEGRGTCSSNKMKFLSHVSTYFSSPELATSSPTPPTIAPTPKPTPPTIPPTRYPTSPPTPFPTLHPTPRPTNVCEPKGLCPVQWQMDCCDDVCEQVWFNSDVSACTKCSCPKAQKTNQIDGTPSPTKSAGMKQQIVSYLISTAAILLSLGLLI